MDKTQFLRYNNKTIHALFSLGVVYRKTIKKQKQIKIEPMSRNEKQNRDLLHSLLYLGVAIVFCGVAVLETKAADNSIPVESVKIDSFERSSDAGRFFVESRENPEQQDYITIPDGQNEYLYESDTIKAEFDFNSLGIKWNGWMGNPEDVEITVHFTTLTGPFTRVLSHLDHDVKQPLDLGMYATRSVIVEDATSFSYDILLRRSSNGISPMINSIEIVYFDSTAGPLFNTTQESPTSSTDNSDDVHIISRSEWGADESLRFTAEGEEIWPREYVDPDIFIVHHTAGTDGGDDPAATIRSVYYWHAVVLGWGDIGYSYIIDPAGNIYKGRAGKDGVVAGHTFNDEENTSYNEGSIGIVLLGCFEETPGACYSEQTVTPEMEASLAQLIGTKASELSINPTSRTTFHGTKTKRVVGHRDLDRTYCPGSQVENDLTTVRQLSRALYNELATPAFAAESSGLLAVQDDQSEEVVIDGVDMNGGSVDIDNTLPVSERAFEVGELYTLIAQYVNTGRQTWTQDTAYLKIYNGSGKKPTRLRHHSWNDSLGKITMNEESVAPGETATFTFTIRTPQSASTKKMTTKLFVGKSKAKKSTQKTELAFVQSYAASLVSHTLPIAILHNTQREVSATFRNIGQETWDESVVLMLNGETVGQFGDTYYGSVKPGEDGTITFAFDAPKNSKNSQIKEYRLQLEASDEAVSGSHNVYVMRID